MGKQNPILQQIKADRERFLAAEKFRKAKDQEEKTNKALTPQSVLDGTDPDYGAPEGFEDYTSFGKTPEARLDSSKKLIQAEIKAIEEAKKQQLVEQQKALETWNDPKIQEQFQLMRNFNAAINQPGKLVDPNSIQERIPGVKEIADQQKKLGLDINRQADESYFGKLGNIVNPKLKKVSADEIGANKVSNFLMDAGLYDKPIAVNVRGILDGIAGGQEKITEGSKEILDGDVLRGSGKLTAGTLQAGMNMIPAVVGLNATMPIINEVAAGVSEGLGGTREQGENIAGKLAPFLFGKWIGLSSLASWGVDEGIQKTGILDDLSPEDQILARELVGHLAFFGTLLGGKKITKKFLDPKLDAAFPYTRGMKADVTDPKVMKIMDDYVKEFNLKKAEFEKENKTSTKTEIIRNEDGTTTTREVVTNLSADKFNKWAQDRIQQIIKNEKPAFFRNLRKDLQNIKEARRYKKAESKSPLEVVNEFAEPNARREDQRTEPMQDNVGKQQETGVRKPKTDLGNRLVPGQEIVSPQRSIEAPKGNKPIVTPAPGVEPSGKPIVTPPAKLKGLPEKGIITADEYWDKAIKSGIKRNAWAQRVQRLVKSNGGVSYVNSQNHVITISGDPKDPGKYKVAWFDDKGAIGDIASRSLEEAAREFVREIGNNDFHNIKTPERIIHLPAGKSDYQEMFKQSGIAGDFKGIQKTKRGDYVVLDIMVDPNNKQPGSRQTSLTLPAEGLTPEIIKAEAEKVIKSYQKPAGVSMDKNGNITKDGKNIYAADSYKDGFKYLQKNYPEAAKNYQEPKVSNEPRIITAEDMQLNPELTKGKDIKKVAIRYNGKVISAVPGEKGINNHADLITKNVPEKDWKKVESGFTNSKGEFLDQYGKVAKAPAKPIKVKRKVEVKQVEQRPEKNLIDEAFYKVQEINEAIGSQKLTKQKEARDLAKKLREKFVNAKVEKDGAKWYLYLDGKKQTIRSLGLVERPEVVPIDKIPIKYDDAKKPFRQLSAEQKKEQLYVIKGYVEPSDLPPGYGQKFIEQAIKDIESGQWNTKAAMLVRDAAVEILTEGKDVKPSWGTKAADYIYLSPEEIRAHVNAPAQAPEFEQLPPDIFNAKAPIDVKIQKIQDQIDTEMQGMFPDDAKIKQLENEIKKLKMQQAQDEAKLGIEADIIKVIKDKIAKGFDIEKSSLAELKGFQLQLESQKNKLSETNLKLLDRVNRKITALENIGEQTSLFEPDQGSLFKAEAEKITDTPEFKKWFGNSKMVNEKGEPIIAYHGTPNEFRIFDPSWIGTMHDRGFYGKGFYFTFNTDPKWNVFAESEASYYGKVVMPVFLKIENPFDFSTLSDYKGIRISYLGTESLVFLNNLAKKFPQIAKDITISKKIKIPDQHNISYEWETEQVPISILPELFERYSKELKIGLVTDSYRTGNDKPVRAFGYLPSKAKTHVFLDSDGKERTYIDDDDFGHVELREVDGVQYPLKEEIEILLLEEAIRKYEGIEADLHPEGYMTRNPQITDAIRELGHDGIIQSKSGDEAVVFDQKQIKSINNEGKFSETDPDIYLNAKAPESDNIKEKVVNEIEKFEKAVVKQTDTPEFKWWFGNSKVVDQDGKPLVVYSGHSNTALYGNYDPRKSTAGGFYATENPDISTGYALGKFGTYESWENGSQYRIKGKNGKYNKKLWQITLTDKQKAILDKIADEQNELGENRFSIKEMKRWAIDNKDYEPLARRILARGVYDLQTIFDYNEWMGYNIAYPSQPTEANEPLFLRQRKNDTEEIMDRLGIDWNAYDWAQPGIFPLYLRIQKPLDADLPFPEDLLNDIKKAARYERYVPETSNFGGRNWTKEYPLREWIRDIEDGSEGWTTQIPAKALPILKRHGYDGIKERGSKGLPDPTKRQVNWIAFEPEQIKSAIANKGTFDPFNKDMLLTARALKEINQLSRMEIEQTIKGYHDKSVLLKNTELVMTEDLDVRTYTFDEWMQYHYNPIENKFQIVKEGEVGYEKGKTKYRGIVLGRAQQPSAKNGWKGKIIHNGRTDLATGLEETVHIFQAEVKRRYPILAEAIRIFETEAIRFAKEHGLVIPLGNELFAKSFVAQSGYELPENTIMIPQRIYDAVKSVLNQSTTGENIFDKYYNPKTRSRSRSKVNNIPTTRPEPKGFSFDRGQLELFSVRPNAPPFFSKMQKVFEQKLPSNFAPDQLKNILKTGEIKEAEIKWSGIEDWIESKGNKISKKELLDFIKHNNLQYKTISLGGKSEYERKLYDEKARIKEEIAAKGFSKEAVEIRAKIDDAQKRLDKLQREHLEEVEREEATDEVYREYSRKRKVVALEHNNLLDQLQKIYDRDYAQEYLRLKEIDDRLNDVDSWGTVKYSNYKLDGGENYQEILFQLPMPGVTWTQMDYVSNDPSAGVFVETKNGGHTYKIIQLPAENLFASEFGLPEKYRYYVDNVLVSEHHANSLGEAAQYFERNWIFNNGDPTRPKRYYQSPHWTDENVFAHIRKDDRLVPEPATAPAPEGFYTDMFEIVEEMDTNSIGEEVIKYRPVEKGGVKYKWRSFYTREEAVSEAIRMFKRAKALQRSKKHYFLQELQSDWALDGRRKGWQPNDAEAERIVNTKDKTYNAIVKLQNELMDKYGMIYVDNLESRLKVILDGGEGLLEPEKYQEAVNYFRLKDEYRDAAADYQKLIERIPDMPFKTNWHEFVLKAALRQAAEEGYDVLSWTKGIHQIERYDLSKYIKRVRYSERNKILMAYDMNDGLAINKEDVTADKLADYIGKEAAKKLLDQERADNFIIEKARDQPADYVVRFLTIEGKPGQIFSYAKNRAEAEQVKKQAEIEYDYKELEGLQLRTGGEWAINLYDKVVPTFLNKYGKKWNAKVYETTMGDYNPEDLSIVQNDEGYYIIAHKTQGYLMDEYDPEPGSFIFDEDKKLALRIQFKANAQNLLDEILEKQTVHSFPITPEMKQSVLEEGQPLFSARAPKENEIPTPRIDKYINKVLEDMPDKLSPEKEARLSELRKYKELSAEEKAELKALKEEKANLLEDDPFLKHRLSTLIKMKIRNLRSGYKIGSEERQKQLTDLKKDISAYARKILPRGDYKKSEITPLLTELAKAKDLDGAAKVFTRIRDLERKVRKRKLIGAINKMIRNADRSKGDPDFVIAIKNIRRLKAEDVEMEIAKIYERAANRDLTDEEDQFLYLLQRFSDIKNRSVEDLEDLYAELKEGIIEGRSRRKEWLAKEKERIQDLKTKAIDVITGGKKPLSDDKARVEGLDKEETSTIQKLSDFDTVMHSWEWILDKLSKLDKGSKPLHSFLNEYFADKIHTARNQEDKGLRDNLKILREKMMEIYGTTGHKLTKILSDNSERKETLAARVSVLERDEAGIPTKTENVRLILSQNEAAYLLMVKEDPNLAKTFEKMGYNERTWTDLEKFVKPKVMEWARWQLNEFYPAYYQGVNDVYKQMRGVDLNFNKKYMPISRDVSQTVIDQEFLGDNNTEHVSIFNGHLQPRIANTHPIRIQDIDRVLMEHIIEMEHFKAFAPIMKDLRGVFGSKDVSKAIKQYHSPTMLMVVNRFINDFARGGVDRRMMVNTLDKIRSNFAKAVLGINPVVLLKQLTSFPAYLMDLPVKDFATGIADFMLNPVGKTKFLLKNSEHLKSRYNKGWERDIILAMQRAKKTTAREISGGLTLTDIFMALPKFGDAGAIMFGGWAQYRYSYNKARKEGKSHEEAKKIGITEFEKATKRSQQAGDVEDLGELQRQGSWAKLWTLFKTSPKQYYSNMSAGIRNLAAGRGTRMDNLKRIFIAHFVLPQLFQFAASGFEWSMKNQLRALALGSLNGLLIAGDILQTLIMAVTGDTYFRSGETPIQSVAQDFVKALKQFNKWATSFDMTAEDFWKTVDELASATSKFVGIPYDPLSRIATGIQENIQDPENADLRRIVGYSPYSIKDEPAVPDTIKLINERQQRLNDMRDKARKTMNQEDIDKAKQYERDLKKLKERSSDWKKKQDDLKEKRKNDPFTKPKKPKTPLGNMLKKGL